MWSKVLIETQWNVNEDEHGLERFKKTVLIETQWNVNHMQGQGERIGSNVLIETQWNVNTTKNNNHFLHVWVLIETQWNVNAYITDGKLFKVIGFNRDIVECKCRCKNRFVVMEECFNRDIVECKYCCIEHVFDSGTVLIETQWNVNAN